MADLVKELTTTKPGGEYFIPLGRTGNFNCVNADGKLLYVAGPDLKPLKAKKGSADEAAGKDAAA